MGRGMWFPSPGGGGSGAPVGAPYVTTAADPDLTGEQVLGTAVIMAGTEASRPAASVAGRLYFATDTLRLFRDTGAAWTTVAVQNIAELTASGLTTGALLRATAAGTFAFQQIVRVIPLSGIEATTQWTNLGAGETDLNAAIRAVADLSLAVDVRCAMIVRTAGVTGDAKLQYSTDNSTWADLTTNLIDLSSTGVKLSTWQAIPGGAQVDGIAIRVVALNGNTTEDPVPTAIELHWR